MVGNDDVKEGWGRLCRASSARVKRLDLDQEKQSQGFKQGSDMV